MRYSNFAILGILPFEVIFHLGSSSFETFFSRSAFFLAPKTDIVGQFLGPETDVMSERYFMVSSLRLQDLKSLSLNWDFKIHSLSLNIETWTKTVLVMVSKIERSC